MPDILLIEDEKAIRKTLSEILSYEGYKIDEAAAHSTKWVTAAMSLAGVFISLYIVIRSVKS